MSDEKEVNNFLASLGIPKFDLMSPSQGFRVLNSLRNEDKSNYVIAVGKYGGSLKGDFEVVETITRLLNRDMNPVETYDCLEVSQKIEDYFSEDELTNSNYFELASALNERAFINGDIYTGNDYNSTPDSS